MPGPSLFGMTEALKGLSLAGMEPGSHSCDVFHPKELFETEKADDRPEWTRAACGTKNKGKFCQARGSPRKDGQ